MVWFVEHTGDSRGLLDIERHRGARLSDIERAALASSG